MENKMKKLLIVGIMMMPLFIAGCNKGETRRVSRETSQMSIKFNELVKAGKTTREQEKAYIDAVALVCFELDRAIRGTKEAERTKRNATIEAKTGINPEGPIELNMDEKALEPILNIVEKAAKEIQEREIKAVREIVIATGQ
jgi:hypothetical protein